MWHGLAAAGFAAATVAGAVAAETSSPLDGLLAYGPLGMTALALATGWLVPKPTYDRAIADRDRSDAKTEQVTKDVMDRVMPALNDAIQAVQSHVEVKEVLADVRRLLEQLR